MSKLKIKMLKDKPHKVYSANIELDYHIEELSTFLNNHKDRVLEVVINGKKHKFNSITSRKRFAAGFKEASRIIAKHTKSFAEKSQDNINKLTNELTQIKKEKQVFKDELARLQQEDNVRKTVTKLRVTAWQDRALELEDACEILKTRLDKVEPVIDKIKQAKSDGDLNAIHIKVKKGKL